MKLFPMLLALVVTGCGNNSINALEAVSDRNRSSERSGHSVSCSDRQGHLNYSLEISCPSTGPCDASVSGKNTYDMYWGFSFSAKMVCHTSPDIDIAFICTSSAPDGLLTLRLDQHLVTSMRGESAFTEKRFLVTYSTGQQVEHFWMYEGREICQRE